jgi:hypothetical protein
MSLEQRKCEKYSLVKLISSPYGSIPMRDNPLKWRALFILKFEKTA